MFPKKKFPSPVFGNGVHCGKAYFYVLVRDALYVQNRNRNMQGAPLLGIHIQCEIIIVVVDHGVHSKNIP